MQAGKAGVLPAGVPPSAKGKQECQVVIVQPRQYTIKLMAHRPDCRSVLKVERVQNRARAPPRTGGRITSTAEWSARDRARAALATGREMM